MKTANCSDLVKLSIPALRCALAQELAADYNMDQSRIASSLGITQAAVNKYLGGKCSHNVSVLSKAVLKEGMLSKAMLKAATDNDNIRLNRLIDGIASGSDMIRLVKMVLGIEITVLA